MGEATASRDASILFGGKHAFIFVIHRSLMEVTSNLAADQIHLGNLKQNKTNKSPTQLQAAPRSNQRESLGGVPDIVLSERSMWLQCVYSGLRVLGLSLR